MNFSLLFPFLLFFNRIIKRIFQIGEKLWLRFKFKSPDKFKLNWRASSNEYLEKTKTKQKKFNNFFSSLESFIEVNRKRYFARESSEAFKREKKGKRKEKKSKIYLWSSIRITCSYLPKVFHLSVCPSSHPSSHEFLKGGTERKK